MCVLPDAEIRRRVAAGALGVEPFEPQNLTPNGLDLRIAEIMLPDSLGTGKVVREGTVDVPARERFLVSTAEAVRMPPDVCASLWIRSSWARKGVVAGFGKVEAGFAGTLTVGAWNGSTAPVTLGVGDRFCQIVFETMRAPPERLYAEASGTYQEQSGITLAREGEGGAAAAGRGARPAAGSGGGGR